MIPVIWSKTDKTFSHFGPFFVLLQPPCPSPHLTSQRIKILRKWKNICRYHHFTQVYHKCLSYGIWFLRYEVHQSEFFCHLGLFFFLFCLYSPKNNNLKKMKKKNHWRYYFTQVYQKSWSYAILFLTYDAWQV